MTTRCRASAHHAAPANLRKRRMAYQAAGAALALGLAGLCAGTASAGDLCNNTNTGGVLNNPQSHRTPCVLTQAAHVTQLITYHWNNGQGAKPGTILLFNPSTGQQWGPFRAGGTSGQAGAPNVNWIANVNLTLPAGAYQIIDSDFATWSWNPASGGNGFAKAEGDYVTTPVPPPLPPRPVYPPISMGGMLCDNSNTGGVLNDPMSHRTPCELRASAHISQLITYHWNNGQGARPGTILLFNPNTGQQWGPFQTTGSSGQRGAADVNWTANVSLDLPAGCYQIIDSEPRSWSWNQASGGYGFAKAAGRYTGPVSLGPMACGARGRGGPTPPPPPPPPPPPTPGPFMPCHANSASFVELAKPVCFGPTGTTLTLYVSKAGMKMMPPVAYFRSGAGYNYISNQLGGPMNTPGLASVFSAPLTLTGGTGLSPYSTYTFTIPPGTCFSGANHTWWFDLWVPGSGDVDAVAVRC